MKSTFLSLTKMNSDLTVKVAVENTTYVFDRLFDYLVPKAFADLVQVGKRVPIPFGRGNKKKQGVIFELSAVSDDISAEKLKSVCSVLDDEPVLSKELLKLAEFMKEHYFCTYYDAVKTMLPAGINYKITTLYGVREGVDEEELSEEQQRIFAYLHSKRKAVRSDKLLDDFGLDNTAVLEDMVKSGYLYKSDEAFRRVSDAVMKMAAPTELADSDNIKLTEKQKAVLDLIKMTGGTSVKEVCYFTGVTTGVTDALYKKGLIYYYDEEVFRIEDRTKDESLAPVALSEQQQTACDNLYAEYADSKPHTSLLFGVTGSGKTSVFMKLIERVINDNKGIIVMVPEISLTPQFVSTFSKRFGEQIAVFHSALSLGERLDEYKRVKKGLAKIVIGTRSAVFAPFKKVGLIIMDEEQEGSYQSENVPRYDAREVAKYLCVREKAALVFGSATPTVETAWAVEQGSYQKALLRRRYNENALPEVLIADLRQEILNGNPGLISTPLRQELEKNLAAGEQSILFLNRRGSSRMLLCGECGYVPQCPRCSTAMTYHSANGRLMCHYCGHSEPAADTCPECGGWMKHVGAGTQKVEEELRELFPEAGILRMDADTTAGGHEEILQTFERERVPILLGTQMVAKGLDFENVTLVGVLSADISLYVDNYRAAERTFSLLTQVVGRAGRGGKTGRAVIQTYTPGNDVIRCAARQDYDAFYESEIRMRRLRRYPPFADLFTVTVSGTEEGRVLRAAVSVRETLRQLCRRPELAAGEPEVLGLSLIHI